MWDGRSRTMQIDWNHWLIYLVLWEKKILPYLQNVARCGNETIKFPVDEKWMRRLDLPSLHLILANYAEAAARTAWLRNVGRPFRSRLLQLLLRSNIRRFSGTVGDIDIEPESRQRVNSFLLSPCSSGMIETGVCLSTPVCSLVGGARMNGNCYFGKTCCVINSKAIFLTWLFFNVELVNISVFILVRGRDFLFSLGRDE